MQITVNGETHDVPAGRSMAWLLEELGRRPELCAVERNEELVPRTTHGDCELAEGDRVEIVTLVGGG